jgi:hypothetical protein
MKLEDLGLKTSWTNRREGRKPHQMHEPQGHIMKKRIQIREGLGGIAGFAVRRISWKAHANQ